MESMWQVYVLYSERLDRSYVGCSADVDRRVSTHNAGQVTATRSGVPWRVIYVETVGRYAEARRRERYYKSAAGRRRLKTIFADSERWPSGLRRSTGNAVCSKRAPWVQIPPSPPFFALRPAGLELRMAGHQKQSEEWRPP